MFFYSCLLYLPFFLVLYFFLTNILRVLGGFLRIQLKIQILFYNVM